MIYSIVETPTENGLNPQAYLQYLFEQLPSRNANDPGIWDALVPWSARNYLRTSRPPK